MISETSKILDKPNPTYYNRKNNWSTKTNSLYFLCLIAPRYAINK